MSFKGIAFFMLFSDVKNAFAAPAKIFPVPFASRFTSLHKNSIIKSHNVCAGFFHDTESAARELPGAERSSAVAKKDIDNHFSRQRHENRRKTSSGSGRYSEKNPSEDGGLEDI